MRDWKDPDEPAKVVSTMQEAFKFDDDFDFDMFENNLNSMDHRESEVVGNIICCCHKEIPHDESNKF